MLVDGVVTIFRKIVPAKAENAQSADSETVYNNLFPTNYKTDYLRTVTRCFENESQIPRDDNGNWILDGVYCLDYLKVNGNVHYVGNGTIYIGKYLPEINGKYGPLTINGDILAADEKSHLNLVYIPTGGNDFDFVTRNFSGESLKTEIRNRMINIIGTGKMIQASVVSFYGVYCESEDSNLDKTTLTNLGMDTTKNYSEWKEAGAFSKALNSSNCIIGNYVNYYTFMEEQKNDLWVYHDTSNSFYFGKDDAGQCIIAQYILDLDNNNNNNEQRLDYEKSTHELCLSPKIQHLGITGDL